MDNQSPTASEANDFALLTDIEAALIAFDGLFAAIFELSSAPGPTGRRLDAICAISAYLIDELDRARVAMQVLYERRGAGGG